jgi:hypothetical protein
MCGDRTAMICHRQRHSSFHGRSTRSLIRRPSDLSPTLSGNRRRRAFARRWHERDRLWHSVCGVLWPSRAGPNECSTDTAIGRNWIGLSFSIGASWNGTGRLVCLGCVVPKELTIQSSHTRRGRGVSRFITLADLASKTESGFERTGNRFVCKKYPGN